MKWRQTDSRLGANRGTDGIGGCSNPRRASGRRIGSKCGEYIGARSVRMMRVGCVVRCMLRFAGAARHRGSLSCRLTQPDSPSLIRISSSFDSGAIEIGIRSSRNRDVVRDSTSQNSSRQPPGIFTQWYSFSGCIGARQTRRCVIRFLNAGACHVSRRRWTDY